MKNELEILRLFVKEFHPFYANMVNKMNYTELTEVCKEIVKEF